MSSWSDSFHLSLACDYFYDCYCDQCDQDGRNVEAKGYCSTCNTYLCPACYAAHLRPHARRHHVLDETEMPQRQQQQQDRNICVETCPVHPEMKMAYVCYSHREFCCKVCVERKHQNCRGVDYIPDVADEIVESGEFGEFQETISKMKKMAQQSVQTIQTNVELTRRCNTVAHEAMSQFRNDVMDALDRIEESVLAKAEQITTKDEERMKVVEGQIQEILKTTEVIDTRFSTLKTGGQLCQLFMALKRAPFEIAGLESRLADRCKETEVQEYTFELSGEAHAFIQSPETMIKLEKKSSEKERKRLDRKDSHRTVVPKPLVLQRKDSTTQAGIHTQDSRKQEEVHTRDSSYREKFQRRESTTRREVQRGVSTSQGDDQGRYVTNVECPSNDDSNDGRSNVMRADEFPRTQAHLQEQQSSGAVDKQSGADSGDSLAEHIMDINVRTESDRDTPDVTSSVLMPGGKLLIVDLNNSKVKMIDLAYIAVTAERDVSLPIWDITQVSNSKAAVLSFQNKVIYVVNVTDGLNLDTTIINTRGPCGGIACVNDTLIVTCSEPMAVEVVSMSGEVLQTLVTGENAAVLFTEPMHLAVDSKHQTLYVSDLKKESVTALDLDGDVKAVYKDANLKSPNKLTVSESGFVYICGFDSHNIHCVSADLEEQRLVLTKSDGVTRPQAISCCDVTGSLYVGMARSEILKVYQLK